ncbi:MAG: hemolysin family protein [Firmicutes bacterium]|nr:hemolysin family protein [Bacillota bacterium]
MIYYFVILVFLITLSALYSAAEMSYNVVNQLRVKKAAAGGNKKAIRALHIINTHDATDSTILFGNNLVNIAASSLATIVGMELWGSAYGASLSGVIIFVIILVFGELLPKALALRYAYRWALNLSAFVYVFRTLFFPIVYVITKLVTVVAKLWTKRASVNKPVTDDELVEMVDTIEESGEFDEKQGELLRSAIDFTDTEAFEIMTPRVDVFAYNIEDDIKVILNDPRIFSHSRIPVYQETIDQIIGILPTKLLLKAYINGETIDVRSLLLEPNYVYRGKPISAILADFKATHQHIAIVKDEFGGTEGIVTMEDIVEELVGEIWDETDVVEEQIQETSEGVYLVDGAMNIEDFFDYLGYEKDFESVYTTVGGWCQERLERFAKVGDSFRFANFFVTVLKADEFTVEQIKVEIRKSEDEEEDV